MSQLLYSSYLLLPDAPGVYRFKNQQDEIIYVGKARNLKKRVSSYFSKQAGLGEKTRALVGNIQYIEYTVVESDLESLLLEANYIKKFSPKYNIRMTDGKAYPLIRITMNDSYPKVLIARHPEDPNSQYFGPYPNAGDMKLVLKTIRKIFPYQSVLNHPKRICLYHHLGLCPCPPMFDTVEYRKEYKQTIRHIVDFLEGKSKKVIKDLEKERDMVAKEERFELAAKIQKRIDAIILVTTPTRKPFEYEINPNLRSDVRESELKELQMYLQKTGVKVKDLHRIECYDMSNIQGHQYVGSMVVLTDGEIDKSQYRKFKIRLQPQGLPNDFATMKEVVTRRLKHDEWEQADLIIVDGGKGQVSTVAQLLEELHRSIPLVGLAKREETIITPDFTEIRLPKDSKALHLVQRIRDEAHRFAISYHRKLRSRNFLK